MAAIDIDEITQTMTEAMKVALSAQWKAAKPFVGQEAKSFAQNIRLIEKLQAKGEIDEVKAQLHMNIQRNAFRIVLLTIEGLGILAVEAAINAAIDAVKGSVNTTLGWNIL